MSSAESPDSELVGEHFTFSPLVESIYNIKRNTTHNSMALHPNTYFDIESGGIGGLRPLTKVIPDTYVILDKSWYHIILTNTNATTLVLPDDPESGQTYEIMRTTKYGLTLAGNGNRIYRMDASDSGDVINTTHDACIECIRVVYDGTR